ncbi:MAG: EI24 domain-containing protein [Myxococcota bacterium]
MWSSRADAGSLSLARQFGFGISRALHGVRQSLVEPTLRWLSLGTIVLHVLVYGTLLVLGLWLLDGVVPAAPLGDGLLETLMRWLLGALQLILVVIWSLVSVWLTLLLGGTLGGPLLDTLSERTERLLLGGMQEERLADHEAGFLQSSVTELLRQGTLALLYWPLSSSLVLLTVLPVVGTIAGPLLTWCLTSMWSSLSFLGPTASRHGLGVRSRLALLWRYKGIALGCGAPASVPLLSALLLPLLAPGMVIGMTEVFLALAATEHVPSRLTETEKTHLRERLAR